MKTRNWKQEIHVERYSHLKPSLPYLNLILNSISVNPQEYDRIEALTVKYPNDPRLIEMVRNAGDSSAKVVYLMDWNETPDSIQKTLRDIASPHIEHIRHEPDALRATIYTLLSLNTIPLGHEIYAIPALLEIDRIQGEMTARLHELKAGRQLSAEVHQANQEALQQLDAAWPELRKGKTTGWSGRQSLPRQAKMHHNPVFMEDRLIHVYEECIVLDSPGAQMIKMFTPPVLQRPLPECENAPATGSVDWLIREVGKIGRQFTRALIDLIKERLEAEHISIEEKNFTLINQQANDALRDYIETKP
jgi:hypothetical protein